MPLALLVLALCARQSSSSHHSNLWTQTPWSREQSVSSTIPAAMRLQGGSSRPRSGLEEADSSREKLYEAYNLLHTLGKDFDVNIQAPSVLVVGHQTSGKSALIEALMGFQFNNVGGGTKTRRPIALHMRYNAACDEPMCFLTNDVTGREERMTLEEIQTYITAENKKLESDPTRCFNHREIVVRIEYRYCPNMVVVDTPGLISGNHRGASEADGVGANRRSINMHERAHAQMCKESENLVLNKMMSPEYIILCIEDTTDWKHATTRALVEQVDPHLSRTVLVNTKLDTKLPQFSEGADVEDFILAPILKKLHPHLSGGPFFTSVPSGRVGRSNRDAFRSNEAFIRKLRRREMDDLAAVESKVGRREAAGMEHHLGVRRLRRFLEQRVEKCYRANVANIVPVLQGALRRTEDAQAKCRAELLALSTDSLKFAVNNYREHFSRAVADCIQGSISAPPDYFGETLEEEQLGGGSFVNMYSHGDAAMGSVTGKDGSGGNGDSAAVWARLVEKEVGHAKSKLYGGSQYHRSLREFASAVRHMSLPEVTADEIANAAGVNDVHDGTNYMRAACVIAVAKAQVSFDPLLEALQVRTRHIMRRLFPIVTHMLDAKGVSVSSLSSTAAPTASAAATPKQPLDDAKASAQNAAFVDAVQDIFHEFVESALSECAVRCEDDLKGMTRFVTWDLQERGSLAIQDSLPSKEMVHIYALTMKKRGGGKEERERDDDGDDEEETGALSEEGDDDIVAEWANAGGVRASFDLDSSSGSSRSNGRNNNGNGKRNSRRRRNRKQKEDNKDVDLAMTTVDPQRSSVSTHDTDVLALMEQLACMGDGDRTITVVSGLVQHIVRAWRMSFAQNVAMKFNCFFLLPFLDEFPFYLRTRLDQLYDTDLRHLFDLTEARQHLEARLVELDKEAKVNRRLQTKFEAVNKQLRLRGRSHDDESQPIGAPLGEAEEGEEGEEEETEMLRQSEEEEEEEELSYGEGPTGEEYEEKAEATEEEEASQATAYDDEDEDGIGNWWMGDDDEDL